MARLTFNAEELRRVVEHSINAPTQSEQLVDYDKDLNPITKPVEAPAVILVHDHGVYLMSNGTPRDIVKGDSSYVVYAKGCNPDKTKTLGIDPAISSAATISARRCHGLARSRRRSIAAPRPSPSTLELEESRSKPEKETIMRISPGYYETNRTEPVQIGARYTFCYPDEFTTLPEYTAHAGQTVTVVRQLTEDECDQECQPMWLVRADDGWTGNASDGELDEVQQ